MTVQGNAGSALYVGTVLHRRLKPRRHRLVYRVFSMLLDLDEIDGLAAGLKLFSLNRFNLFSFHHRDYGPGDGSPLRPWVERQLARAGIDLQGGPIRLLCYPRILGYVFNPLSVYFCHRRDGTLAAIVYEVSNTFSERHSYLIPVSQGDAERGIIRQRCDKGFYVSPFIAMEATYHFRIKPPQDDIAVVINQHDPEGPLLHASFVGERQPLTDRTLARVFASHPLMTLKVMGGIHWEALKLWRKGVPLVDRPPPPPEPVTVYAAAEAGTPRPYSSLS